jgi:predicted MFS family arabinose efflux permease
MVVAAFLLAAGGGLWLHSVVALALAGVLLDSGVQACLVFGQRAIYGLAPSMRSRLNGIFMAMFFCGGALGSALTSPVLTHFGWSGICAMGVAAPLSALAYFALVGRG